MRKYVFMLLLFVSCMHSASLTAQTTIKKFSPDSLLFLEEMTTFMSEERKKETKKFMEEFVLVWFGGKISEQQRQGVYKTTNFMLDKKMPPFPEFKSYLFSLMSFINSNQSIESFNAWQDNIEKLVNSKSKKQFTDYLEFCNYLFSENIIYKSASTVWQASNNNYVFDFDDKPIIIFPSLNLHCLAKEDSAVIYNTQGVYYPTLGKWVGKGGKVNWLRGGFQENQVYALLNNYEIECKSPSYTADSVVFYNSIYFDKPLMGILSEKVLANVTLEKASYPRFESYDKRLKIPGIVKNVDYDGGFSQHGAKFMGSGNKEADAYLIFYRDNKPLLKASSKSFVIRTNRITSADAAIIIYLEQDSIFHPGLQLNFLVNERQLALTRTGEGISQSPYFDSFHNIDLYFEVLNWKIDDPLMTMSAITGSTDKNALFESDNYYSEERYYKLQGIDDVHPLYRIKKCSEKYNSKELYADELADFMQIAVTQVKMMLMKLATQGFLTYNYDNDRIQIKERLYHYINSKAEKTDYDVLQFNSIISSQKHNASLNLLNFDLKISGVQKISLSEVQKVFVYPKEEEILLKKNRDFTFAGRINAGRFEIFGDEFSFIYDDFKLNLNKIDSLRLVVLNKENANGKRPIIRVRTILEYLKGELFIDKPYNKSGIKKFEEYPIFNSLKDCYAFYQKSFIYENVYSRDSFYFHLEPFTFDSLDNFTNEGIAFKGTFFSANIFPDFDEILRLRPDYSLGFIRGTPKEGFPAYGGKGFYYDIINLSNEGLRGKGVLKYLTSTTKTDNFIFFPDSMNTFANEFYIEEQMEGVEFPPVVGKEIYIHWMPYNDVMYANSIKQPFVFYDGTSKLHGRIALRPTGLTGGGLFEFEGAELEANNFNFQFKEFTSDTADFRLKLLEQSGLLSFSTSNVSAHVDFSTRKAEFRSNGGGSFIDFPVNQYICYMDKFTWFMDDNAIELSASNKVGAEAKDVKIEGAKFISTHPQQDSLTFYSKAARYDVKNNIIHAKEVDNINVADALIYPDSSQVFIEKKAKMRTLENARILANNATKYHTMYNAVIDIHAKKDYTGSGYYDYINEAKRKQTIYLNSIAVDSTAQTVALADIEEEANFSLSPNYEYQGKAKLIASNKYLTFTGASRISHNCDMFERNWFKFSAEIDPEEIFIPIDTITLSDKGEKLNNAVVISRDSIHVYSTFLSKKYRNSDFNVLPSNGYLFYDKKNSEYQISNLEKLNERSFPGNFLSFNTSNCMIYSEGTFDFGADLGKITTTQVGNILNNLNTQEVTLDMVILIDFFFADDALENMAQTIIDYPESEGIDFDRPAYSKGLQELLGKGAADKLISDINLYGSFKKFPDELAKSMFLTDVKMKWNTETHSYLSVGQIGVGNILKKQVNKRVDGYIEIEKKRGGDILQIYIEIDPEKWYFFSYQRGLMQAISSNEDFNNIIKAVKPDKRKLKHEKGEAPYAFQLSTKQKKDKFLLKFEK